MTPRDTLEEFLALLHPAGHGWTELRALPSRTQIFVPVANVDAVAAFLAAHAHENCYIGVATRRSPASGALANCDELAVLFVDIDYKTLDEHTAHDRLTRFPLRPSLVVRSGAGLHVYFALREPIMLPDEAPTATAYLRRLARHFGGDQASAEPARILRIPGSWNYKYATPIPVTATEPRWVM